MGQQPLAKPPEEPPPIPSNWERMRPSSLIMMEGCQTRWRSRFWSG